MSEIKTKYSFNWRWRSLFSVIDIIENGNEFNILGILDSNIKENNILGYKILGGDNLIPELVNENTYFLITVGQIKSYSIRKNIAKTSNRK